MSKDLITIALPTYNNEKTISTTIESIIFQTYPNWELIVVDDASTDNTVEVVKSYKDKRIKIIKHEKNQQIAKSLNDAIKIAKGKYFARIDGDDYCYPNRLETQLSYLNAHPNVDLVGCELMVVDRNGKLIGKRTMKNHRQNIYRNAYSSIYLAHPTFFGKTAFFRKYKYKTPPVTAQDQDLLLRGFSESKYANIDKILVCYQENLKLKKVFRARVDLMISRYMFGGINSKFLQLVAVQITKILIDTIAITTGLKYRILKHRASSVSEIEKKEWSKVTKQLGIS